MFDLISETGKLEEPLARRFFKELILGLHHMNAKGKCHRDIKLENIMLDHDYRIVYVDLGFVYDLRGDDRTGLIQGMTGTP